MTPLSDGVVPGWPSFVPTGRFCRDEATTPSVVKGRLVWPATDRAAVGPKWFEGRGPRCVLIEFIDDATSRVLHAEFVVEGTHTLLRVTRTYLERWGRPAVFHVDKDSIYKVNREATVEEQLEDAQPLTQFSRAMAQLAIAMIQAERDAHLRGGDGC